MVRRYERTEQFGHNLRPAPLIVSQKLNGLRDRFQHGIIPGYGDEKGTHHFFRQLIKKYRREGQGQIIQFQLFSGRYPGYVPGKIMCKCRLNPYGEGQILQILFAGILKDQTADHRHIILLHSEADAVTVGTCNRHQRVHPRHSLSISVIL